jgi:hypothetical protein
MLKTINKVPMTNQLTQIILQERTILNISLQNQLVILKEALTKERNLMHKLPAKLASSARLWRLSSAPIRIRSTTLKACAITATISMEETAMQMLALIPIDSCMPRVNARTAILMTITNSREDSRKIKLDRPRTVPSNSSKTTLSLKELSSENQKLRAASETFQETIYPSKSYESGFARYL